MGCRGLDKRYALPVSGWGLEMNEAQRFIAEVRLAGLATALDYPDLRRRLKKALGLDSPFACLIELHAQLPLPEDYTWGYQDLNFDSSRIWIDYKHRLLPGSRCEIFDASEDEAFVRVLNGISR